MTRKCLRCNGFTIFSVRGTDYRTKFQYTTKSKAVYKMKNTDISEKGGQLWL